MPPLDLITTLHFRYLHRIAAHIPSGFQPPMRVDVERINRIWRQFEHPRRTWLPSMVHQSRFVHCPVELWPQPAQTCGETTRLAHTCTQLAACLKWYLSRVVQPALCCHVHLRQTWRDLMSVEGHRSGGRRRGSEEMTRWRGGSDERRWGMSARSGLDRRCGRICWTWRLWCRHTER